MSTDLAAADGRPVTQTHTRVVILQHRWRRARPITKTETTPRDTPFTSVAGILSAGWRGCLQRVKARLPGNHLRETPPQGLTPH